MGHKNMGRRDVLYGYIMSNYYNLEKQRRSRMKNYRERKQKSQDEKLCNWSPRFAVFFVYCCFVLSFLDRRPLVPGISLINEVLGLSRWS